MGVHQVANHGLTEQQLSEIRGVLAPFADRIDRVGLFGSRATGKMHPQSDVDLVLHGALDEGTLDRIWTLFSSSNLSIKVDVVVYELIAYPPLKSHIDAVEETLFMRSDLQLGDEQE